MDLRSKVKMPRWAWASFLLILILFWEIALTGLVAAMSSRSAGRISRSGFSRQEKGRVRAVALPAAQNTSPRPI